MTCFLSAWNVNTKADTNTRCENLTSDPCPSHSGRPFGQATMQPSHSHPSPPHSALDTSDYASLPTLFACTAPHDISFERQTPSKTKSEKLRKLQDPKETPEKTICALSLIRDRGRTLVSNAGQVFAGTKPSIPPALSPPSKTASLRPCTVDQCPSASADHAYFVQITGARSTSIQLRWLLCSAVTERCFLIHWGRIVLSCETPGPI